MVIGYIAEDRMFVVLDRFFMEEITDNTRSSVIRLKTGKTVCSIDRKSMQSDQDLDKQHISKEDRESLKIKSEANRANGIALADEICRKYRREGRFFDEILKAGE